MAHSRVFIFLALQLVHVATCECPSELLEQQYPQFQIIATAKTGSTSLYSYLCQHPSIQCLARKKETNLLRNPGIIVRNEKVRND